jgi:pimeloyl-ACP methyl ester carboxylesterase
MLPPTGIARTADGRDLAFCEWGSPTGSPVIYLHGTPGSRYFRHAGGEYDRTGIRAITYDRPGYGRSTRLSGRTVAQTPQDVATIADHLGLDRFAVVGASGGGPHALAAAAALQHRVTRCATVVGVGPHDAPDLDIADGMATEDVEEWRAVRTGEWLAGPYYRGTRDWVESLTEMPGLSEHDRDMVVEALREALAPGPYGLYDDLVAMQQPWGFDLADVVCPTRVMIAREDTHVPPAQGQWLAAHLPTAQEVWVEGGHMGPRDEPEEQLLAWLAAADG